MYIKRYRLKDFLQFITIFLFFIIISCSKNSDVVKNANRKDITYLISTKIEDKDIEIIKFEADIKNKLKITIKNNSNKNISANSIAIFKEGNATGQIIKDTIKTGEEKTITLNITLSKKKLNVFNVFRKIN